jgi:hypothetical protein
MKLTSKDHKHKEKKLDLFTVHTDNIAFSVDIRIPVS